MKNQAKGQRTWWQKMVKPLLIIALIITLLGVFISLNSLRKRFGRVSGSTTKRYINPQSKPVEYHHQILHEKLSEAASNSEQTCTAGQVSQIDSKAKLELERKQAISGQKHLTEEDKPMRGLTKIGWFIWNFLVVSIYLLVFSVVAFAIVGPGPTNYGLSVWLYYPGWIIMMLFGLISGWTMHQAVMLKVAKLTGTGVKFIDAGLLAWFTGFMFVMPPVMLVAALHPDLFDETLTGRKLLTRLHWAARLCIFLLVFGAFMLWAVSSSMSHNGP